MSMSRKEKERLNSRLLAMEDFFVELDKHGGYYCIDQLALKTSLSEINIINQIESGVLIGLKHNKTYLIPAFQFSDNQKIPYLEEILLCLTHVSNTAKCSFFLNSFYGSETLVYKMLNDNLSPKRLELIKRDARNFLNHVSS